MKIDFEPLPIKTEAIKQFSVTVDGEYWGKLVHFDMNCENVWRLYHDTSSGTYLGKFDTKEEAIKVIEKTPVVKITDEQRRYNWCDEDHKEKKHKPRKPYRKKHKGT